MEHPEEAEDVERGVLKVLPRQLVRQEIHLTGQFRFAPTGKSYLLLTSGLWRSGGVPSVQSSSGALRLLCHFPPFPFLLELHSPPFLLEPGVTCQILLQYCSNMPQTCLKYPTNMAEISRNTDLTHRPPRRRVCRCGPRYPGTRTRSSASCWRIRVSRQIGFVRRKKLDL